VRLSLCAEADLAEKAQKESVRTNYQEREVLMIEMATSLLWRLGKSTSGHR
jgi:hypothetical protein